MYKEQYIEFLKSIYRKHDGGFLSQSSIDHYARESIRKIDEFIINYGISSFKSIYDINSLNELEEIKSKLLCNPEFIRLDTDGNRMYSAGLNRYIDFAEGRSLYNLESELILLDKPIHRNGFSTVKEHDIPDRDRIIIHQSAMAAGYNCQINQTHETFIAASNQLPYVEGHHIIPLKFQDEFNFTLDNYANVLILCPNCHRLLHYGDPKKSKRIEFLNNIYQKRKERFRNIGIRISQSDFLDLALSGQLGS